MRISDRKFLSNSITKGIGMKKSILLILLICYKFSNSFQTSSESVNSFNQFMGPSDGINVYSGDVLFSQPLCKLPGRNGVGIDVTLNYSSNIYLNVRSRNDIAPTSWCGLGWNLNYGSVVCNHKGTKSHNDDDFWWISPNGVSSKIINQNNNVNYAYYEGSWTALPLDYNSINPIYQGQCNNFEMGRRFREGNYVLVFTSNLLITTAGDYKFYTKSDDGSKLFIDGELIVNNDGIHQSVEVPSALKYLDASKHTIRVEYFQADGESSLEVSYEGPGITKTPIPESKLSVFSKDEYVNEFYIENDPFTKITPVYGSDGIISEWVVRTIDGKILKYGSNDERNATRKTFCVGNTVGVVSTGVPTLYPYQWDLFSIQDHAGNMTRYYYSQKKESLVKGTWSTGDIKYTKESHVEKIVAPDNSYVLFESEEKSDEAYDPYVFVSEPDGYIEMYDSYRLKKLKVFRNAEQVTPVKTIELKYTSINAGDQQLGNSFRKSLLYEIAEYGLTGNDLIQKITFNYYDEFTNTDPNYNYGALKSFENLQGGKTEFTYKKQTVPNTRTKTFQQVDNHQDLCFGSLSDGTGYCVVQYGENKDKLAIYNWDGGKWVLKNDELTPRGIGNYGLTCYAGIGYFVIVGGEHQDLFWLYQWDGNNWQVCKAAEAPGDYGVGHNLSVNVSPDHIAIAGGINKDKICVYTRFGLKWKMTLDLRGNPPWNYGNAAHLTLGHNFLVVVAGEHQDQIFVYNWNGESWNTNYQYFAPAGTGNNSKNLVVSTGNNCFVVTGGENSDYCWIYSWDGSTWSLAKTFVPNGFHNKSSNLIAVMGDNFIAITGGENRDKVWRCTYNGIEWSAPDEVTAEQYGSKGFEPQIGNNYFTVTGAANNDKVFVYRWNGRSWDDTKVFAPEGTTNDNRHFKVYAGENYFVLEGGINTDKVWVYTYDGSDWRQSDITNIIGHYNETKYVRGSSKQFGVRCGEDGDNLWLFQKFQDNFETPIFNYVVDYKTVYSGIGNSIITRFAFDLSTGNYDTRAGTAKYNKVETIFPGNNGKTIQYFFNDLSYQNTINADYGKLDGLIYRYDFYNQTNSSLETHPLSTTTTEYSIFRNSSWPLEVEQKRINKTIKTSNNISTVHEFLSYNNNNGVPFLNRTITNAGKQLLSKAFFAFENPVYAEAMGQNGVNLLTATCQNITYEKVAGDNSIDPQSQEIRSAQATTWSNMNSSNYTWLPSKTFKWNADFDDNGVIKNTFVNFNHTTNASNQNWALMGSVDLYDSYAGALQSSNPKGIASTIILKSKGTLPIAKIANSTFRECAVLTGDYADGIDPEYFDKDNGWAKAGSILSTTFPHYGDKSIHVYNTYGPTKNVVFDPNLNHTFSANILHVPSGDAMSKTRYVKMAVEFHSGEFNGDATRIGSWDLNIADLKDGWNLYEHTIKKDELQSHMFSGKNAADIKFARIWIGNVPKSNTSDPEIADLYVEDIRFYPSAAFVTTTYYDATFGLPIQSVDANNKPGLKVTYDGFGRAVQWDKYVKGSDGSYTLKTVKKQKYYLMKDWLPDEYFRVNTPKSGDVIEKNILGRLTNVEWETNPSMSISQVKITIISDQHTWDIQSSTNNDGNFLWYDITLDKTYTNCKIRISDVNNSSHFIESDGCFTIEP
jgi:hypothetical protein